MALRRTCLWSAGWECRVLEIVRIAVDKCTRIVEWRSEIGVGKLQLLKLLWFILSFWRYTSTWLARDAHLSNVHGLCYWHPRHLVCQSHSLPKLPPRRYFLHMPLLHITIEKWPLSRSLDFGVQRQHFVKVLSFHLFQHHLILPKALSRRQRFHEREPRPLGVLHLLSMRIQLDVLP